MRPAPLLLLVLAASPAAALAAPPAAADGAGLLLALAAAAAAAATSERELPGPDAGADGGLLLMLMLMLLVLPACREGQVCGWCNGGRHNMVTCRQEASAHRPPPSAHLASRCSGWCTSTAATRVTRLLRLVCVLLGNVLLQPVALLEHAVAVGAL
jgi:hypothetical protein